VNLQLLPVTLETLPEFSMLLTQAALWLEREGKTLWNPLELTPKALLEHYRMGEMYLATLEGEAVGTAVLMDSDLLIWPDALEGEAMYAHKLCTARARAGQGLGHALLDAARAEARGRGKAFLRLDTSSQHPPLCAFYEGYGFEKVEERQVGPYLLNLYQLELSKRQAVEHRIHR